MSSLQPLNRCAEPPMVVVSPDCCGASGYALSAMAATLSPPQANNSYGSASAVVDSTTVMLVNIVSSSPNYKITGIVATGNADGYYEVRVGSGTVLSGRTTFGNPTLAILLNSAIVVPAGSAVVVRVTNTSGSTANYEAILLGI